MITTKTVCASSVPQVFRPGSIVLIHFFFSVFLIAALVGVTEHFGLTGGVCFGVDLGVVFGVAFGELFDGDRVRVGRDCVEPLLRLLFDEATELEGIPNSLRRGGAHPR